MSDSKKPKKLPTNKSKKAAQVNLKNIFPPIAPQKDHITNYHGEILADPYFWLREKEDPDTIPYIKAENKHTKTILAPTEQLQKDLFKEMKARIKADDMTVPVQVDQYFYYVRFIKGKDYPILCRKKDSLKAKEEITLDCNKLAKGKSYFSLGAAEYSPDHQFLAYFVDFDGSEKYTLQIKNLEKKQTLPEQINNLLPSLAWAASSHQLFYTKLNSEDKPDQIYLHTLNNNSKNDLLVYQEKDPHFFIQCLSSRDQNFIFINSHNHGCNEIRFISAHQPESEFKIISPRTEGHNYSVDVLGKTFYIRSNRLQLEKFQIYTTPTNKPAPNNWKTLIPFQENRHLEGFLTFTDHLVYFFNEEGLSQICLREIKSKHEDLIQFPEASYSVYSKNNPTQKSPNFRYGYSSFATPSTTFEINLKTQKTTILKQEEIPSGHNPKDYQVKRIWATADDGVKVPVSLIYHKKTKLNGTAPGLLNGYGSYGHSNDAGFRKQIFSLVDRGFIFAICHIRGGGDMGRHWYEDGKLLKKKNTFTDFVACTKLLTSKKYIAKDQVFARGGSAGGMLMGNLANNYPKLYRGIIALVPFVDVINTMFDDTLPLTQLEYNEWGNPHQKESYQAMRSYSPYENVTKQSYPNILITGGLNDPRVTYWEPTKWTAKLRANQTGPGQILLKIEMDSGHGGKSGRFEYLKEPALEYAFLFYCLGINPNFPKS